MDLLLLVPTLQRSSFTPKELLSLTSLPLASETHSKKDKWISRFSHFLNEGNGGWTVISFPMESGEKWELSLARTCHNNVTLQSTSSTRRLYFSHMPGDQIGELSAVD